jgi:hypothetical protein
MRFHAAIFGFGIALSGTLPSSWSIAMEELWRGSSRR